MDNEQAIELLDKFTETLSNAVRIAVWASAFLVAGGEPTWDAVKSLSGVAESLAAQASQIVKFRDEFEDIAPF